MRSLRPDAKFGRRRKRQIPRLAGRLWATAAAPRRVSTTTQTRASRRSPADTCRSARAHRAPARRPAPRAGTRPRRAGPRPRPAGTRAARRARRARLPAAAAAASRACAPAPAACAPAAPRRGAGPARQTRLAMSGGPAARRVGTKPPRSPCASERPLLARWRESGKVYMVGREGAGPERQQRPAGVQQPAALHAPSKAARVRTGTLCLCARLSCSVLRRVRTATYESIPPTEVNADAQQRTVCAGRRGL